MSPTKKRQTMGKITRERELKERRALKKERKDEKKLAAAAEGLESQSALETQGTGDKSPADDEASSD